MNKNDLKLIVIILIIVIIFFLGFQVFSTTGKNKKAFVYYEDKIVLKIDLNKQEKQINEVDGYNGKVTIISENGKVKVEQEKSPLHLCSKQGYISKSYETIVCLPNKITIKIESDNELDTIVK